MTFKLFCFIAGGLLIISLAAAGWFRWHSGKHVLLMRSQSTKASQLGEVVDKSHRMTLQALDLIKAKKLPEAVDKLIDAINLFPLNTPAYQLLARVYLKTGREQELYEALDRAGDSFANFNEIISSIDDADFDNIPLPEHREKIFLADLPENKKMALSFFFDDGEKNIYDHLTIFEKYGFRATISVVAGFVGSAPQWGTWQQWRDASSRGFEIANHSMDHRDLSRLSDRQLHKEIEEADALIENNIGHEVKAFVFPEGSYSPKAVAHALKVDEVIRSIKFLRSVYARTVGIVYGGPFFSSATADRLVDIGMKRRLWIVAKCHGITATPGPWSYKPVTPGLLEAHLAYIHSKSDDIYVDTFTNVYDYLNQRRMTNIVVKDFSAESADFVLHSGISDILRHKPAMPLTVALKTKVTHPFSAQTADGRKLKCWPCAIDKLCVDVDVYDKPIHMEW